MAVIESAGRGQHVASPQHDAAGDIGALVALVAADMERVNATILARTGSQVTMVPEVANHLISSGGKRLRPMLTLAAASHCGAQGDGHVKLAASVEFMHTATLLHDDVVDESAVRRGKPAARMVWGNQASVLVGDFLLGQAFKMMVETGSLAALAVLADAAAVIAEGEVLQLAAAKNVSTTEDTYFRIIHAKTAVLFGAAAEVGPIIAASGEGDRAAFAEFGLALGNAFQLVDDALDYGGASGRMGKSVGDDFREGKLTLPLILAYRAGTPSERLFWRRAVERGATDDAALAEAIAILERHGAIEETVARAALFAQQAKASLERLRPSPWTEALATVADFTLARSF